MASLLLLVIYLTFISLMAASAFRPNALRKAEGRMRLEAALDWEPYAPGDRACLEAVHDWSL